MLNKSLSTFFSTFNPYNHYRMNPTPTAEKVTKAELFGVLDFNYISRNPDFKEDSVREVIILPILYALGYNQTSIVRSKALEHPFYKIGSNKKRPVVLIPDYVLKVENNFAWILDAKSPDKRLNDEDNLEQVFGYASHPEIRSTYFALCNGLEFVLYRRDSTNVPVLYFYVDEIEYSWDKLKMMLAPDSFQVGKSIIYERTETYAKARRI
jgi:hypothetical protein